MLGSLIGDLLGFGGGLAANIGSILILHLKQLHVSKVLKEYISLMSIGVRLAHLG